MEGFSSGDRVRIDIPDETDPDHDQFHNSNGEVVAVIEDNADNSTGDCRDSIIYRVELEKGQTMDFRWRDLRPPLD